MTAKRRDGISVLGDLHQQGSMRVLFPRPASPPTAVLLNTAGGITGGDVFKTDLAAGQGAELTVTTQAAERAYAALPGPPGSVTTHVDVAAGGTMRWLPQETILFRGAALDRRFVADLAPDATLLFLEILVFGRAAHGEKLSEANFRDRIRINRDGLPLFVDGIHLTGDAAATLAHPARGAGAGALATLVLATSDAARHRPLLRDLAADKSGTTVGVSALSDDLLVLRALARDSFDMRRVILPVLDHLTDRRLPTCWRL